MAFNPKPYRPFQSGFIWYFVDASGGKFGPFYKQKECLEALNKLRESLGMKTCSASDWKRKAGFRPV